MSIYEEEIEGREFDWYAIDTEGNIGIFTTAGEGGLPPNVLEGYKLHDEISEFLDSPNWGSSEVWSDYSEQGFYVFDWALPGGPYRLEGKPTTTMKVELRNKITNIAEKMNINFGEVNKLANV